MSEETGTFMDGVVETIKTVVYALLIAGVFRTLFFQPFWIPVGLDERHALDRGFSVREQDGLWLFQLFLQAARLDHQRLSIHRRPLVGKRA